MNGLVHYRDVRANMTPFKIIIYGLFECRKSRCGVGGTSYGTSCMDCRICRISGHRCNVLVACIVRAHISVSCERYWHNSQLFATIQRIRNTFKGCIIIKGTCIQIRHLIVAVAFVICRGFLNLSSNRSHYSTINLMVTCVRF